MIMTSAVDNDCEYTFALASTIAHDAVHASLCVQCLRQSAGKHLGSEKVGTCRSQVTDCRAQVAVKLSGE